jgi:pilus assembly protein Flp/PilA
MRLGDKRATEPPSGRCSLHQFHKEEDTMTKFISRFVKDESGATAIEYGLIAALIAVFIIGALQLLGGQLNATFAAVTAALAG